MNELLFRAIEQTRQLTLALVDDLTDEDLTKLATGLDWHPAYILGHLDLFDSYVLRSLNENPPEVDSATLNLYGPHPMTLDRKADFQEKGWYVHRLLDNVKSYQNVLRSSDAGGFLRDNPFPKLRQDFPKVGDLFAYVPRHETHHVDDLVQWRSLMGYPPKEVRRFKP